jgi:hypothetical protein
MDKNALIFVIVFSLLLYSTSCFGDYDVSWDCDECIEGDSVTYGVYYDLSYFFEEPIANTRNIRIIVERISLNDNVYDNIFALTTDEKVVTADNPRLMVYIDGDVLVNYPSY